MASKQPSCGDNNEPLIHKAKWRGLPFSHYVSKVSAFLFFTFIIFFSKLGFMLSGTTNDNQTDGKNELIL